MNANPPSGLDLRLERVAQRVSATALARVMGVSGTRVSHVEALAVVTPEMVIRYRGALATCVQERTSPEAVA